MCQYMYGAEHNPFFWCDNDISLNRIWMLEMGMKHIPSVPHGTLEAKFHLHNANAPTAISWNEMIACSKWQLILVKNALHPLKFSAQFSHRHGQEAKVEGGTGTESESRSTQPSAGSFAIFHWQLFIHDNVFRNINITPYVIMHNYDVLRVLCTLTQEVPGRRHFHENSWHSNGARAFAHHFAETNSSEYMSEWIIKWLLMNPCERLMTFFHSH